MNKQPKVLLMWVSNGVDVGAPHVSSQLNCPAVNFSGATLILNNKDLHYSESLNIRRLQ